MCRKQGSRDRLIFKVGPYWINQIVLTYVPWTSACIIWMISVSLYIVMMCFVRLIINGVTKFSWVLDFNHYYQSADWERTSPLTINDTTTPGWGLNHVSLGFEGRTCRTDRPRLPDRQDMSLTVLLPRLLLSLPVIYCSLPQKFNNLSYTLWSSLCFCIKFGTPPVHQCMWMQLLITWSQWLISGVSFESSRALPFLIGYTTRGR